MWNPLHETDSASVAWPRPRRLCAVALVLCAGLFVLGFLFGTRGRTGVRATLGPQPARLPRGPPGSGAPCRGVPAAGLRGGDRAGGRADQLPRVRWDLVAGEARLRSGRAAGGQAPTGGERRNPETELEKVPPAAGLREIGSFPQDLGGHLLGRPRSFVRNGSYLFGVLI